MRTRKVMFVPMLFCLLLQGCMRKPDDDNGGTDAPGTSKNNTKVVFKYDPSAPKEWLRIQKGRGEGAHVDVFVGRTKTGTLNFGTIVQKIGEERGWFKIRYANDDGEFFGYIRYSDAEHAEKYKEPTIILVGEDAEPKMYTLQQMDEKLDKILRVPYKLEVIQRSPEVITEKVFCSVGSPDGYDGIILLKEFKNEPEAIIHAKKMYTELEKLYRSSPPEYKDVLKFYAEALSQFKANKIRFFDDNIESAEHRREYVNQSL